MSPQYPDLEGCVASELGLMELAQLMGCACWFRGTDLGLPIWGCSSGIRFWCSFQLEIVPCTSGSCSAFSLSLSALLLLLLLLQGVRA